MYKKMSYMQIKEKLRYIPYNKPYIGFVLHFNNDKCGSLIILKDTLPFFLEHLKRHFSTFLIIDIIFGSDANYIINNIKPVNKEIKLNKKQIREILFSLSEEELQELGYQLTNYVDNDEEKVENNDYSYQLLDVQQVKKMLDNLNNEELITIGLIKI